MIPRYYRGHQQPINVWRTERVLVYAALTWLGVVSFRATRCWNDRSAGPADSWELGLHLWTEAAALMAGYIASGIVALLVTVYLFIALLFPERF
jgi:K+-transporting ATPase KdpF subunit